MASSQHGRWMGERSELRSALLTVLTFALVFLVALGSSRSLARVGGPGRVFGARLILGDLFLVLLALVFVLLCVVAYVLGGIGRRRRRSDELDLVFERPAMTWWSKPLALLLVLAAIGGPAAAVAFFARNGHRGQTARPIAPAPAATFPQRPAHREVKAAAHAFAAAVHWWILAGLALVALAAVALLLLRRRHTGGVEEAAPSDGVERGELRGAIEASLDELEREPDPRRAVIRAYVSMERVLARHGLGRRPFEAPLEYLARALAAIRVSRTAGERLTALFQRARFSEHAVDAEMKQDAIAALVAVRDELEADAR